jgi:hypothetical protein
MLRSKPEFGQEGAPAARGPSRTTSGRWIVTHSGSRSERAVSTQLTASVRDGRASLHGRGPNRGRGLCGRRDPDRSRRQPPALAPGDRIGTSNPMPIPRRGPCRSTRHPGRRGLGWGDGGSAEVRLAVSPTAQWTGALRGPAFFAYGDNYSSHLRAAIIVDVEASRAIRQAEVGAARTMMDRTVRVPLMERPARPGDCVDEV